MAGRKGSSVRVGLLSILTLRANMKTSTILDQNQKVDMKVNT